VLEERTFCFEDGSFVPWAECYDTPNGHGGRSRRWAYHVNDPIGTPEELVDGAGQLTVELDREAWGKTHALERAPGNGGSPASTPLRFQGQIEDAETGLFYNRHRYYDPAAGIYLSPDPIGLEGGLRTYGYVPNPTGWIDAFGLTFARPYSRVEVSRILDESEGRVSPKSGQLGHPRAEHVRVPASMLIARASPAGCKTSFESSQAQDRATTDALNSPAGQAELAKLDADPTLKRVRLLGVPIAGERVLEAEGGRGYLVSATAMRATIIVDRRNDIPGDNLHVQTSYGKL
jgi:RHS repeat-associated protein